MDNNILKYTSKDYNSIFKDLTDSISSLTDLWTSREDGDPGIVLVKLMSALGDMLSFNLDKQALEYYAPTVTQRKNAQKLFNLIGYKMHWYQSALTTITITNSSPYIPTEFKYIYSAIKLANDGFVKNASAISTLYVKDINEYENHKPVNVNESGSNIVNVWLTEMTQKFKAWQNGEGKDYTIDLRLFIDDKNNNLTVYNNNNVSSVYTIVGIKNDNNTTLDTIPSINSNGSYVPTLSIKVGDSVDVIAVQGSLKSITFTNNNLTNNRYYIPHTNVDETYMYLKVSSNNSTKGLVTFFKKVDNLLTTTDGELNFEFNVDDFDLPYIELCNYWESKYGTSSVSFTLYYITSNGTSGNVTDNYLNSIRNLSTFATKGKRVSLSHMNNNNIQIDSDGNIICKPGVNPQTARDAYMDSINYITTYETIVTIYDFERFTKRQKGISNAKAIDGQRAMDLNETLSKQCYSLTLKQLQTLFSSAYENNELGVNGKTQIRYIYNDRLKLANELYERRTLRYSYIYTNEEYKNYGLNLHVVYGNFDTKTDDDSIIATYTQYGTRYNIDTETYEANTLLPYFEYQINIDNGYTSLDTRIQDMLDKAFKGVNIVNVRPEYTVVRVFPWRICGTIYLTQPVTSIEASNILQTVISTLSNVFHPKNLTFGKMITYMDVIDAINNSHSKIKYFDAGIGNNKLISFSDGVDETYFNEISLMHYVQTYNENEAEYITVDDQIDVDTGNELTKENPYYHLLQIDPQYILD